MPYNSIKDLPEKVRGSLPEHAQKIYLKAYNNATGQYQDPKKIRASNHTKPPSEVVAHKVAWAAVKKKYRKTKPGQWTAK